MKEALDMTQAVGPVERVLHLLICFQTHNDGLSLTELAKMTNLSPATATRLLRVLERYEFIHRGPDRLYRLGPQVMQLGLAALQDMSLYEVSRPHLRQLAEETGESTHLGILLGEGRVLYVDQVSSRQAVQAGRWVGRTVPVSNTAIGTAIQGHVDQHGYVARRDAVEPEVSSVAAPIYDQTTHIVGAINVIGPTYRISDEQLTHIGTLVAEHARQISLALGASIDIITSKEII
ncbi:IclR family transcriptional regulator [Dictyobacter vulcani]|uniref:IclR family transcriptional regulator n=1 Tax=Dictyobacter vulcani TaxID=2607529 RepID=A0A5J4KHY5_9CHLR|nr:IclR family transcriptional regulator [Dictyobacter vulcani]GER86502.1 IclR family transcriptional regulator [Dictyobacter vulcani]